MKSSNCLFILGCLLLSFFLIYVFICQHRFSVTDKKWLDLFSRYHIPSKDITHDESVWYYQNNNTCVFYSENRNDLCPRHSRYCSSGKSTAGSAEEQVKAIKEAINNGGEHPQCPLIYPSVN